MDEQEWAGDERRGAERREGERRRPLSVLELVDRAAHEAAQQVGAIHRRRLVVQSAIAAFIAALLVCVPLVVVTNDQRAADSRDNARYNCHAIGTVSHTLSSFISSDAKLRYRQQHYAQRAQVMAQIGKIIDTRLLDKIASDADKNDTSVQDYWTNTLVPKLEALAQVNCAAAIR